MTTIKNRKCLVGTGKRFFSAVGIGLALSQGLLVSQTAHAESLQSLEPTASISVLSSELMFGGKKGTLHQTFVKETGQVITFEDRDGRAILQGDIDLGSTADILAHGISFPSADEQLVATTMGEMMLDDITPDAVVIPHTGYRWTNNTVPYILDSGLSSAVVDQINYAINHWESRTSLRFVQRTSQSNYIRFQPSNGTCSSRVGMVGGEQAINLDSAARCGNGATIHEIAHAMGIWHEQSRNDRDSFVTINFNNVPENNRHNFDKVGQYAGDWDDGVDHGSYDFNSIMHYGAYDFAIDRSIPVIQPLDSSIPLSSLGQRNGLSTGDLAAIAAMYGTIDNGLVNGVPKTGLSGAKNSMSYFTMEVPAGAQNLAFNISGGSGDADLYIQYGSAPTLSSYICRPWKDGNVESCPISNAQAGTYHVMLHGYNSYSGVSLVGSYSGSGGYFENTDDYSIPDYNATGIYSPIAVNLSSNAGTISVAVNIVHTYIGDLVVDLIHPDGTVYNLHNASGGSSDNINKTYSVSVGNKSASGTWYLRAVDRARYDTGYINSWSMTF